MDILVILHSNVVTVSVTLDQTLRGSRVLLENNLVALNESVCLNKDLARRSCCQNSRSDFGSKPLIHTSILLVQLLASLEISSSLVDLKLLQEFVNGRASVSFDLGPIEFDSQVAEVILGVLELAELWLRQEDLQDGVAGLHMSLAPFLRLDVVEL
jgi:hypothetical protein